MCEIIILIAYGRALARAAQARGRSAVWWMLGIGCWLFGEITGFFLGGALELGTAGTYVGGLFYAAIGAGVGWLVVTNLPPRGLMADVDPASRLDEA